MRQKFQLELVSHKRNSSLLMIPPGTFVARRDRQLVRLLRHHIFAIVDSSDDAIFAETLDGVIVSWNYGAGRMYGYTAREIIGRPVSILVPSELSDELPPLSRQLSSGE